MSPLGLILIVILVIVLLGGIGPHFYTGAPWRPGYGFGNGGIGVVGVVLIIVLILWLMDRI
jgi:Protein of unknown function (DUF3309)